ncbi:MULTISPECIES: hypothetical protein [unclassified Caulobacter]|jgi:hypothetical protein|uniref:hypothetical protein n=1 Tax=unclassified Caulobacter TaxID=2648921 RepID=UPI000785B78A|nr:MULTISPECIES: hypothetical protein [unclassified Caulobacter]AZS20951.1 calcium-binding protein [Caulobacter sp. FWC26]
MGDILPFIPRPLASDWSANERGLLQLLTQQLKASYGEVDGVFGLSDSGDPWYVVTDANQDVLVHIARIEGQFVVHDAAVDMFHQVGSLWSALRQVMASGAPADPNGVVVAFNPASREAQSFLSLVIAVGLFLEIRGAEFADMASSIGDGSPRTGEATTETLASKLIAALSLEADRGQIEALIAAVTAREAAPQALPPPVKAESVAAHAFQIESPSLVAFKPTSAASAQAVPFPQAQPKSAPPPIGGSGEHDAAGTGFAATKAVLRGTSGDDVLMGSRAGEIINGGAGDDHISGGGAGPGQIDRLNGEAGDDRIVMDARVVATGGAGADTFLISAHPSADGGEGLLGVVLDFSVAQGDQLAVLDGAQMTVVSSTAFGDVLSLQGVALGEANIAALADVSQPTPGARVGFDVNGDGREDVFILLGGATVTAFRVGETIGPDHAPASTQMVPLVGQPTTEVGTFGEPPPRG